MSEDKKTELNGWHGAWIACAIIGLVLCGLSLSGVLTPTPEAVAAAKVEVQRDAKLRDGKLIGITGNSTEVVRFYDAEARMVCYVLGIYQGISCASPGSDGLANLSKGERQ